MYHFVYLKKNDGEEPVRVIVETGISDDNNIEVLSGINENDRIIVKAKKYSLPRSTTGRNPFMPGH